MERAHPSVETVIAEALCPYEQCTDTGRDGFRTVVPAERQVTSELSLGLRARFVSDWKSEVK
jgi:hypothetical protein